MTIKKDLLIVPYTNFFKIQGNTYNQCERKFKKTFTKGLHCHIGVSDFSGRLLDNVDFYSEAFVKGKQSKKIKITDIIPEQLPTKFVMKKREFNDFKNREMKRCDRKYVALKGKHSTLGGFKKLVKSRKRQCKYGIEEFAKRISG